MRSCCCDLTQHCHSNCTYVGYSIKKTAARNIAMPAEGLPESSYHFQRVVAVCLVAALLRLPDYTMREHVLIVWILEGGHRIRSHDGFCYIYHDDGAFQTETSR